MLFDDGQWYRGHVAGYHSGRQQPYDVFFEEDGQTMETDIPDPDVRVVAADAGAADGGRDKLEGAEVLTGRVPSYPNQYDQVPRRGLSPYHMFVKGMTAQVHTQTNRHTNTNRSLA